MGGSGWEWGLSGKQSERATLGWAVAREWVSGSKRRLGLAPLNGFIDKVSESGLRRDETDSVADTGRRWVESLPGGLTEAHLL